MRWPVRSSHGHTTPRRGLAHAASPLAPRDRARVQAFIQSTSEACEVSRDQGTSVNPVGDVTLYASRAWCG